MLKDALDYIKPLKAPRVKNMTEVDDEETSSEEEIEKPVHKSGKKGCYMIILCHLIAQRYHLVFRRISLLDVGFLHSEAFCALEYSVLKQESIHH